MRQVTREEFYDIMRPLTVQISVRGRYGERDYGTNFTLMDGTIVGKTIAQRYAGVYNNLNFYFVNDRLFPQTHSISL